MSTELKTLKGQFHNEQTEQMDTTEMHLTRFSGGVEGLKASKGMRAEKALMTQRATGKLREVTEDFNEKLSKEILVYCFVHLLASDKNHI